MASSNTTLPSTLVNFTAFTLTVPQCLLLSIPLLLLLLLTLLSPPYSPREPPLLRPRLPLIGHILNLYRYQVDYFTRLFNSDPTLTAATLPMLNGKVYFLFDPSIVQSALRHKNLTFDILIIEFAQRVFGLSDRAMEKLWGPDKDIDTSVVPITMHRIKGAMQGEGLLRMNVRALGYIAGVLNSVGPGEGLNVGSLYGWLRDFMTMATSEGIYGSDNPIRQDPSLINALWEFEGNIQPLFLGVLPKILARRAWVGREKVQSALVPWYFARKDEEEDVAAITKVRATTAREFGMPEEEVGRSEAALLFVATTNTIPTLYWFVANVFLRGELVERLREEVRPLVKVEGKGGGRMATLDISNLEERCPLMVRCYKESIRLGNQGVGTRRVMYDTVLTDSKGQEHLLKAGVDVMWSAKRMHRMEEVWGEDAMEFNPERFKEDRLGRAQKQAYIPFGGGKHLCPGRNFAFAENLGFVATLLVGFEVEGLEQKNYKLGDSRMGDAVAKPPVDAQGGEVIIKRREGWEGVEWRFVC